MKRTPRGLSLIEAMIALVVMLVGGLGLVSLNNMGLRLQGDARRITRATALAQDVAANVELWAWDDPRLANDVSANDPDVGDGAFAFEAAGAEADHDEAELTADGRPWYGVAAAGLGEYQRFVNVAAPDDPDGNGIDDTISYAVIVRWPQGAGFRRVVLLGAKLNPSVAR